MKYSKAFNVIRNIYFGIPNDGTTKGCSKAWDKAVKIALENNKIEIKELEKLRKEIKSYEK